MNLKSLMLSAAALSVLTGGLAVGASSAYAQDSSKAVLTDDQVIQKCTEMKEERLSNLNNAVEEGKITAEKAKEIEERLSKIDCSNVDEIRQHMKHGLGKRYGEMIAEKLGLTREEVRANFKDGKTFTDMANAKGVSVDELKTMVKDAMTTDINKAYADGKITEDQKNKALENIDDAIEKLLTKVPSKRGHEKGDMKKGMGMMKEGIGQGAEPAGAGMF